MKKSIRTTYLDHSGKTGPVVIAAMANGATVAYDPADPDWIIVTFKTAQEAQELARLIEDLDDAMGD